MAFFKAFLFLILPSMGAQAASQPVDSARQLVVCLAPTSASWEGTLHLLDRTSDGKWLEDGGACPVLFAPRGLAWGRGVHPPEPGPEKMTGDHRNPAGIFRLGSVLGYAPALPPGAAGWPYHQVTERDAWIDDPALPDYNHLYTLPAGAALPAWWDRERMHLGDSAYQWMVVIEHNYDQPIGDAGNSIFFHVRRGEHYRTSGCTTMGQDDLVRLIKWLRPGSNAMLVELARPDYQRLWKAWHLPPPADVGAD